MFIIEIAALENGAHRNQISSAKMPVPNGWVEVPAELEAEAKSYLPFIELTVEDGVLVAVAQGVIPEPEPVPEPEPTETEQLRADVDYIAIMTGVEL